MRRTALIISIFLIVALGACGLPAEVAGNAPAVNAAAGSPDDPLAILISVKEKAADVRGILTTIFEAMGVNYLITDEVSGQVYLGQRDAAARDILDLICAAKGLHWWKKGDTYVVSAQAPPAGDETAQTTLRTAAGLQAPSSEGMRARSYTVQYRNPNDLAFLFNPKMRESTEGRLWRLDYTALFTDLIMHPTKAAGYGGREFVDTSLRPFDFGISRLGESGQFPGMGGGGFLGRQAGAAGITGPQGMQVTTEEEQALLEAGIDISAPFAALLPPGMTAPIAYEPLNILVFEATDEAYDRFLELVKLFDRKPKQVLLEMQFITMSTSDLFSLGLNWFWNVGQASVNVSGLTPAGYVTIKVAKGNEFGAVLSTLLTTGKARIITSPRIATMNNFPATISFIDQVPYVEFGGAVAVPNGGIVAGGATVQAVAVPTQLTIIPRINGDDSITAILLPVVSRYEKVTVPTNMVGVTQEVPLVSSNSLSTLLNIQDGETMVIGGFVNRNETVNRSKVPLLGDIPILGSLFFTRTDRETSDEELLIFVTPHVIRDETAQVTVGPY
jgi:type II secretory pathway component GspD/PulD (secretin)